MVRYSELKRLYDVEKTIGCGGFAKVKLATHIATGEKVAIKIMEKNGLGDDLPRVKLELKALKSFSHQHICKLYQVIESETHYFIVIEYCSGGELFDHIVEKNRLTEAESRTFFRQIVSAVAYLHSLGYAHRDLKPENVLLDKNQNLKLIDFGLCARPQGGIESPLFTSCGSPTYAAPELVLGKQYRGSEVDVWAMGVLLYALLVGALPFDDLNIDNLYKKILHGRYDEPNFLSAESKRLIKSMLQVDPKNRITIEELLCHPWLTLGILEPVDFNSTDLKRIDMQCVEVIANFYDVNVEKMLRHLRKWKYDYTTATYFLLLTKKQKGLPLKLNGIPVLQNVKLEQTPQRKLEALKIFENKAVVEFSTPPTPYFDCVPDENIPINGQTVFVEPSKPRKPLKRMRSPTFNNEGSPVPSKKPTIINSAGKSTPKTPERKRSSSSNSCETPGSARRVLGSIERSLNKVRYVLTPNKNKSANPIEPVLLSSKDLCNVSTTQSNDPEYVISELARTFQKKGFHCIRKGFVLRGKVEANVLHPCNGCSFELEVCYLPRMDLSDTPTKSILKSGLKQKTEKSFAFVGIKRKRLKGDSWCYKKVCEEVLAVTTKDLRQLTESAV